MTVAIAAICGFPNDVMIVGAADHMLTSGDIAFEQPQPKVWRLAHSCIAMFFGSGSAQSEVAALTEFHVKDKSLTEVSAIAETYARFLRAYVRHRAETELLAPLGMTVAEFAARQQSMSSDLVLKLSKQLQDYYYDSRLYNTLGGAIVAGVDSTGAHIYLVDDGRAEFMDGVGFVAAGSGQRHAESQFMFARFTKWWPFPNALSLVYAAKKRAEVAPGVGTESDIVIVFTTPPNVFHAASDSPLVKGLEGIYRQTTKRQDAVFKAQHVKVKVFLDALVKAPPQPPPPPPIVAPAALPPGAPGGLDAAPEAEGIVPPAQEPSH